MDISSVLRSFYLISLSEHGFKVKAVNAIRYAGHVLAAAFFKIDQPAFDGVA